jgi:hypothetical protein
MRKFITKLASALTTLSLVAALMPMGAFAVAPSGLVAEEFVTVDGSYKGVSVGFRTSGLATTTAVSVAMTRADGSVVTKTANSGVIDIINAPGTQQLTAPFVILEGSFTEESDTLYWDPAPADWDANTMPVSVTITVTTESGDVSVTNSTFNEGGSSWPTYASLIPALNAENFNTHSGSDYKGINVGFNVRNIDELDEVTVELRDANGNTIVTNTGNLEMLNDLLVNGYAQLSTPFITLNLTYGEEAYWELGEWQSYEKPATAVITVNGLEVSNTMLSEQQDWATLIPTVNPENFNTHSGSDYKGVNVGFNVHNIQEFTEVTVELQDANGATLVVNTGNLEKLNELLVDGYAQLSTPFITLDLGYAATEEYWDLGRPWASTNKPAVAIITVNGIVATNSNLVEPNGWVYGGSEVPLPDTEDPVITLIGGSEMTVQENSTFTDPGYTVTDNRDASEDVEVVVSGDVDTSRPGAYEITYTATDTSGNTSTTTRVVNVENSESPRSSSGGGGGGRSSSSNSDNDGDNDSGGEVLGVSTTTDATDGEVLGESTFVFTMDLSFGSTGNEVVELQKFLMAQGYLNINAPTGWFGPMTQAAVAAFQTAHKISPAVGYFGPMSRAKANSMGGSQ